MRRILSTNSARLMLCEHVAMKICAELSLYLSSSSSSPSPSPSPSPSSSSPSSSPSPSPKEDLQYNPRKQIPSTPQTKRKKRKRQLQPELTLSQLRRRRHQFLSSLPLEYKRTDLRRVILASGGVSFWGEVTRSCLNSQRTGRFIRRRMMILSSSSSSSLQLQDPQQQPT